MLPNALYKRANIEILALSTLFTVTLIDLMPRFLLKEILTPLNQYDLRLGLTLLGSVITLMGFLIGFLLNQAQQNLREVQNLVLQEAGRINNLDRLLVRFGCSSTDPIRKELSKYIDSIIHDEWYLMQSNRGSHRVQSLWRGISRKLLALEPFGNRQTVIFADIIQKAEEVAESREARIEQSKVSLPDPYWGVMLVCLISLALINSLFLLFGSVRYAVLILAIPLGGLIALLIIADQPFKGQNSVKPDVFKNILKSIKTRDR